MQQCYYPVTSSEILSGTHNINWTKNASKAIRDFHLSLTTSLFANKLNVATITEESSDSCSMTTADVDSDINEFVNVIVNDIANVIEMTIMNIPVNVTTQIFVDNNNGKQISNLETINMSFEAIDMSCMKIFVFLYFQLYSLFFYLDLLLKEICLMYFLNKHFFANNNRKNSKQSCCPVA